jgi:hypothetical protein
MRVPMVIVMAASGTSYNLAKSHLQEFLAIT